jgi:transposase
MLLRQEAWMELRRFKALKEAGASYAEIARATGRDWRTVKKYLDADAPALPPIVSGRPQRGRKVDAFAGVIDEMLRREPRLRASVIHERLVAEYGFDGHYQRVKLYVREARPRVCGEPDRGAGLHRRFEVVPGAQAQVDWGEEGEIDTPTGPVAVSSFHMTLSYSRDPFTCFVTSKDLGTFWDCHRRAFAHFGGVPATIVYDRTKTVVRRHVGRGNEVPLHPEAVAFAAHYDFAIWLAAPHRPQTKGRVERQVDIVRAHVLAGRTLGSTEEMDAAFAAWLPIRRGQVHRTHGEVIAVRAERDRAALRPLPERPYVVAERHLRRVGKDCLISFEASAYSLPWRRVRAGQQVELRVTPGEVAIWTLGADPQRLATHPRAARRGAWVVDQAHWEGLPDGTGSELGPPAQEQPVAQLPLPARDQPPVGRRDLGTYDLAGGLR